MLQVSKSKFPRRQKTLDFASARKNMGFLKRSGLWGVTVSDFFPGSGMTCWRSRWLELRVQPKFIGFDSCTVPCVN